MIWAEEGSRFYEDVDIGYFLEVDVQYLENVHNFHNDLPFLPEKIKTEKNWKIVANIKNLKQALNYGSVMRKIHIN